VVEVAVQVHLLQEAWVLEAVQAVVESVVMVAVKQTQVPTLSLTEALAVAVQVLEFQVLVLLELYGFAILYKINKRYNGI
jgi:hypothetical protein